MNHIKSWFYLLVILLLLNPLLYFYSSEVIPQQIDGFSNDFDLFTQKNELSHDLGNLIFYAQSYIINGDTSYLTKFNEVSINVLKKEIDLQNKVSTQNLSEMKNLTKLTEEYINFITSSFNQYHLEYGNKDNLQERHLALAGELKDKANNLLLRDNNSLKDDFKSIVILENSFDILATILIIKTLILLFLGVRFIIYPLMVKYYFMSGIVAHSNDVTFVSDAKGMIRRVSSNAKRILGISPSDMLNQPLDYITSNNPILQNLIQPVSRVLVDHKKILNNQVVFNYNEQKLFLTVDYHPFYFRHRFIGVIVVISSNEISKNQGYLYDTIEAERKKISLEIHDWIGRNMSSIIHSLDYMLRSDPGSIPMKTQNDLIQLRTHCQNAVMDMRSIMYEIHPYLIDKIGIIPTIKTYIDTFKQMHNIQVNLFYQNELLELEKSKEIVIFRIIQEALSNVVKHSTAEEVDVYISIDNDTLKIEIMDNGTPDDSFVAGKGLWGMKERAHAIEGDLIFSSNKHNGFTIILTVPLTKEEQEHEYH